MNRNLATMTALGLLAAAALVTDAEAGRRREINRQPPERTEMPAEYTEPHRFDRDPDMQFQRGVLSRDGLAGWRVGDYQLQVGPNTVVLDPEGQPTMLQEGSEVLVMGARLGNTFVGWNVRLLGHEMPSAGASADVVKKPSDASPDVGEIVRAPR
jgi:hypothetical protein